MDKKQLSKEIIKHVGGKDNIENVFHCMTRLRLNLKDDGLFDTEAIEQLEGVMGVNIDGREFQIIIGPVVADIYDYVLELTGLQRMETIDEQLDDVSVQQEKSLKILFDHIVNIFSSCMNPLVPIFVLLGMLNVISTLIGPGFLNIVSTDSNIYYNFYWAGQTILYFLPILIAIPAARTFKTNIYLSVVLSCILLYPDLVNLMNEGGNYTVFGIPVINVTYSSSVIPIMLIIWAQKYVEKFINRFTPDILKVIIEPLLTLLIMMPIALCALGPIGNEIGVWLSNFILWLYATAGPVETMIVSGLMAWITAFGIGRPIFFICMNMLLTSGVEFAYMPFAMMIGNCASWGVALGYAIKSKKPKAKQLGITSFVASFLGGVTEPTLFGILLPNKKTYFPQFIGAGVAGLYCGLFHVGMYQFGTSNILGVLGFMGGDSVMNMVNGCVACVIAFGLTFILMMLKYQDEK